MALESSEVRVAGTGHIYVAPLGTSIPTTVAAPLSHALGWIDLGYATEDGAQFEFAREVNEVMAWQSFDPVRMIVTKVPKSVTVTLLQSNQHIINLAFGGGTWTEVSSGQYRYDPPAESTVDERMFAVEFADGDFNYRTVYRKSMNQAGVSFTWKRGDPIRYPITMKVLAADAGAKPFATYTDDPNAGLLTGAAS